MAITLPIESEATRRLKRLARQQLQDGEVERLMLLREPPPPPSAFEPDPQEEEVQRLLALRRPLPPPPPSQRRRPPAILPSPVDVSEEEMEFGPKRPVRGRFPVPSRPSAVEPTPSPFADIGFPPGFPRGRRGDLVERGISALGEIFQNPPPFPGTGPGEPLFGGSPLGFLKRNIVDIPLYLGLDIPGAGGIGRGLPKVRPVRAPAAAGAEELPSIWRAMNKEQRTALAEQAGLSSSVGQKPLSKLTMAERRALLELPDEEINEVLAGGVAPQITGIQEGRIRELMALRRRPVPAEEAVERAVGPEAVEAVVPPSGALPSGRVPGRVRAEPLGALPPPPPLGELPPLPPIVRPPPPLRGPLEREPARLAVRAAKRTLGREAVPEPRPPLRAEPLGAQPPPPPLRELPPPPEGGLPSGRAPGIGGRPPPPRDPLEQVKAALEPEREPQIDRVRRALPHEFYDRNFALRDLQKRTGVPAHSLAKIVPGAQAAGEDIVRRFYLPLLRTAEKSIPDLEQVMVLRRMEDVLRLHPGSRLPGGLTGFSDIQTALNQLEGKVGATLFRQLDDVATDLWRLNDEQVLRPLLDEEVISQEHYLAMKTAHPHYIPFQRADFVDIIDRSFGVRPEASLSTTGIKRLTAEGSERALDNPLRRLLAEPIKARSIIFRNRAAKAVVEALETLQAQTGEALVEYIEPRRAMNIAERVTGERFPRAFKAERSALRNTVSFYRDGIKNTVEIPALYGRIAKGLDAEPDNIVLQAIRLLNAPLRKGAVELNPMFTPVNIIRDAMAALFREKVFPFGPDYLAGLWAAIRKNSLFSEAAREGALFSGIVETMKTPTVLRRPPLGAIRLENASDLALLLPRLLVAVPRSISGINVIAERGVRLGVYRQLRRQGLPELEVAVRSRDATVDFAQAGHTMRVINQIIPFSNAAVQGSALIARTIRDHPARSAVFASFAASFTIAERLNNMRFETSDQIPDYEYTRNLVIQFGEGTRKDGTKFPIYAKVPKGEIVGLFTFPAEAMFNWARKTEDRSAAEMLFTAGLEQAKVISPLDPQIVPPVPFLQTAVGLATNVDLFTGAPIIPRREQNLLPEQQYGPETSAAAVSIGKAVKVSPRLIDFGIKDYLAGAGQTSNWLISAGLEAVGWQRPAPYGEAFRESAPEGVEVVPKTPVGRFIGTRATQQERRGFSIFNDTVKRTNRIFNEIPEMDRLGIRLGEAGNTIDGVELTPQQRVVYQKAYAREASPVVRAIVHQWQGLDDEQKKDKIRTELDRARRVARNELLDFIRSSQPPVPSPAR